METQTLVTRPLEVRVYEYGLLRICEWCSSERDALDIADLWHRQRGFHCDIVDTSPRPGATAR